MTYLTALSALVDKIGQSKKRDTLMFETNDSFRVYNVEWVHEFSETNATAENGG